MIGDKIEVTVIDIKGDQIKLGIQAPRNVKVYRQEVYEAIQTENRAAALSLPTHIPKLDALSSLSVQSDPEEPDKKKDESPDR